MASAGGGTSKSSSSTRDYTPKQYKHERGFIRDELKDRVSGNVNGIEGPFAAPITAAEQDALSAFQQGMYGPEGLGAQSDASIANLMNGDAENPFLKGTIDAAIRPVLQDAQLKELRDRAAFTGTGQKIQGSTAFAEDRNRAVRDTEQTVANTAAQIAFQDYAQRRQVQVQAVNLANLRLSEQKEGIAAFALPRLIEQYGIDKGNEEMQRRFQVIEQALSQLAGLSTPNLGTNSKSTGAQGNASIANGEGSGAALAGLVA